MLGDGGSGGMALNHGGVASELEKNGGPYVHPGPLEPRPKVLQVQIQGVT